MKQIWIFIFIGFLFSCKEKRTSVSLETNGNTELNKVPNKVQDFALEVYDFNGFKKFLTIEDDNVHVINFWATWCAPCVKELPYFEKLNATYHDDNVEVLLVSLDFPHLYETKLKPFVIEKGIRSKVIALDDVDMNAWIPLVDKNWSGSIPATLIYKNGQSKFFEQSFTYETLEKEISEFLK